MTIHTQTNEKTKFTRMCISEAVIALLETQPFEKIKISQVVKRAGVARMTFYKYYDSLYSALTDYLDIIISEYIEESSAVQDRMTYMSYEHILYSLQFFDRYATFFITLEKNNLHSIMLDGINLFMEQHVQTRRALSVYELYAYAGGLLNSFLKWEMSGKADSAGSIAQVIYHLYNYIPIN